MAQWPTVPLVSIPASGPTWPSRVEVGPLTRVAPVGENQQPGALDVRTERLRTVVNQLVDMVNRIRDFFLDRDGATGTVAQPGAWMRRDFDVGGFQIVKLGTGTASTDAVTYEQLQEVQFEAEDELEQILDSIVFKVNGSASADTHLDMNANRVISVGDAASPQDMMRRGLVDAAVTSLANVLLPRNGALAMTANLSFDGALITDPGFIPTNVGTPTAPGDLATKSFLAAQAATFGGQDVPVGTVLPFAGATVPTNFLLCDGREVSRFTYQNLFNIVGIAYGAPTSSSVFKLPDMRGRVVVGKDNMGGASANRLTSSNADQLGGKVGTELHVLTSAQMPAHTHTYGDHVFASGAAGAEDGADDGTDANNVRADTVRTTGSTGSGTGHENMQPSRTLNYIVRH